MSKEHNFISAVVRIKNDNEETLNFFKTLYKNLDEHFLQFEVIVVNANCEEKHTDKLREWAKKTEKPVTLLNMSFQQSHEQGMNAGMDMAIGDYVYEFDSVEMSYSEKLLWEAYCRALEGNDIVTVYPKKEHKISNLFYRVFNANSNAKYPIRTESFRVVSRRAINRVRGNNEITPYRKAAYATCGLKMAFLEFDGTTKSVHQDRVALAVDSLLLYTDFGYKFSLRLALLMFGIAFAELLYTLVIAVMGNPILGWTTTMFVLTLGLTGIFGVIAIVIKYLSLLLRLNFQKQSYLVESVEKL